MNPSIRGPQATAINVLAPLLGELWRESRSPADRRCRGGFSMDFGRRVARFGPETVVPFLQEHDDHEFP